MVSSIVVICYTFQIKAGNYAACVIIHAFYTRIFVGILLIPENCPVYSFP